MRLSYLEQAMLSPALKLLRATTAPLALSFFYEQFIRKGVRTLSHTDILPLLQEAVLSAQLQSGGEKYNNGKAEAYLASWCSEESRFLSKRMHDTLNEAVYELTADAEKAVLWVDSLEKRPFVAVSSRFAQFHTLLADLAYLIEPDIERKLAEKLKQRQALDREIAELEAGISIPADPALIRDRFLSLEEVGRSVLGDFSGVEENFRELNRSVYKRLATAEGGRGALAGEALDAESEIWGTDQGKSFQSLFEILMSGPKQRELTERIEALLEHPDLHPYTRNSLLRKFLPSMVKSGVKVNKVTGALIEKLAAFVTDKKKPETRRFLELAKQIEKKAITIADDPPDTDEFMCISGMHAQVSMPTERPLFTPSLSAAINPVTSSETTSKEESEGYQAAMEQVLIDREQIKSVIRDEVARNGQVSILQIAERHPFTRGIAEIVQYLEIAMSSDHAVVNHEKKLVVPFVSSEGVVRQARIPEIIFLDGVASEPDHAASA